MGILNKLFGKKDIKTIKETKTAYTSANTNINNASLNLNITDDKLIKWFQRLEENRLNPDSCEREPNDDEIKLPVEGFFNKYIKGLIPVYNPDDLMHNEIVSRVDKTMNDSDCEGYNYFVLLKSDYKHIEERHNKLVEDERKLYKTAELNSEGKNFEKEGNINEAIKCYEENIKLGYPASHSYERLMVLYRKLKDPENEKRIIKIAIDIFSGKKEDYKKRLEKLERST